MRNSSALLLFYILCICTSLIACSDPDQSEDSLNPYPDFEGPRLAHGKMIWLGTCKACHAYSVAGAPKAGDAKLWKPRYAKGRETLYAHAIEGFYGPSYTQMPPRGGNADLTDDDVKAAVDYMLALAGYL